MDKDQEDADKLQKALLEKEKEKEAFGWDSFAFGAILLALVLGVIFVVEHIANWMYFYD